MIRSWTAIATAETTCSRTVAVRCLRSAPQTTRSASHVSAGTRRSCQAIIRRLVVEDGARPGARRGRRSCGPVFVVSGAAELAHTASSPCARARPGTRRCPRLPGLVDPELTHDQPDQLIAGCSPGKRLPKDRPGAVRGEVLGGVSWSAMISPSTSRQETAASFKRSTVTGCGRFVGSEVDTGSRSVVDVSGDERPVGDPSRTSPMARSAPALPVMVLYMGRAAVCDGHSGRQPASEHPRGFDSSRSPLLVLLCALVAPAPRLPAAVAAARDVRPTVRDPPLGRSVAAVRGSPRECGSADPARFRSIPAASLRRSS